MPKIRKNDFKAFTLIELVVVVGIVSLMTTMVIVSLQSGRTQKELETNAHEFASVVRQAQNYALTGKQMVPDTDPCDFHVIWGSSVYTMVYTYKTAAGVCGPSSIVAKYVLKNGVTFSNSGTVSFDLPWARTGGGQVDFSKASDTYSVCIAAEGQISDGSTCP